MTQMYRTRGSFYFYLLRPTHDQTANTKYRKVNLYGKIGTRKMGNYFYQKREGSRRPDLLTPVGTLLNFWDKIISRRARRGVHNKYCLKISNFCDNDYNSAENTEIFDQVNFLWLRKFCSIDDKQWRVEILTPRRDCFWLSSRAQGNLQR